ncbi:uncharacterized protein BDW43DRAFT_252000 [Aspergillus alliaceus]|uniref:uncharacterized protein n=1 Tax=Petromyces alliaceus TaxID=209559 RepID=UPI0012A6327B|nr:uncharacterized protein BDW43DRAFT_252000 [Aspergillus alliaceus]KAB8236284.1 hypothetical protein BDW43DRAFT_252000 [Aspergillus alliaceus]
MAGSILLKNGTLLLHDANDVVHASKEDLLIENSKITKIAQNIDPPSDTRVIDCTDKIVSPGFIDTHHHVWQTSLKATHPNHTLFDYFPTGNFASSFLSADDTFWGQLSGALECLDSGTTTVVDHAHINYSPEHSKEAIRATISSGIRSIFAYCPTPRVAQWTPTFELSPDLLAPWVMETFDQLAILNPFGPSGRVRLGFAFDGLYLPGEVLKEVYGRVRHAGAQLITSHSVYGVAFGAPNSLSAATNLDAHDLLGPDILLSHNTNPQPGHTQLIRAKGAKISSTPVTELQMGHGNPICLDPDYQSISSLGIDCHSVCTAYIPTQMSTVLQWARARRHEEFEAHSKWAKDVGSSVSDVFNLGTIQGARCIGMESEIGSLATGKKADVVIYDGSSPGMLVAADRDPVAAIVLHSSIRDIETVIVDGVVRKEGGKLKDVFVVPDIEGKEKKGERVRWGEVARRVRELGALMDEKKKAMVDEEAARVAVMKGFHLNVAAWADEI